MQNSKSIFFILVCFILTISFLNAQTFVPDVITKLKNNGSYALFPFAGGLNNPQFSTVDFNNDGIKDLFIFDRYGDKPLTFLNNGTPGVVDYVYAPQYENIFPPMHQWAVLYDYNCDGIEDLFTDYDIGIRVYKAVRTGDNLSYVEDVSKLQYSEAGFDFDLAVGEIDIPGFADVDFDGDMDVLSFRLTGGYVDYFQNMQVENGEECGVLDLEHVNSCWGNFFESGLSKFDTLGITCKGTTHDSGDLILHAGSSFMCFDEDADGDMDIVLGDLSFNNLNRLLNGGDATYSNIVAQDTAYPSYTVPLNIPTFPAPFLLDVNNDNKKDMIVAPNKFGISENFKNIWYYKNISATDAYQFQFQTDSLFVNDMVDVGEGAKAVFFDYNKDGLMDIVIGNNGYYNNGNYTTGLALYKNTGTAPVPEFTLITRDWCNISTFNFRSLYPAFADMDNDGDADMLLGEEEGYVHYFENIALPGEDANFNLAQAQYQGIDIGKKSAPQLIDVNEDGLVDIIIGEENGNLNYYENTGTLSSPVFTLINGLWGNVDVRVPGSLTGNSTPFLTKNNSGFWQLFCGSENGSIFLYEPTADFTGTFTKITDSVSNIDEGSYSCVQLLDITADDTAELLTSNYRGGISLYRNALTVDAIYNIAQPQFNFIISPVPASESIFVYMPGAQKKYRVNIFDLMGNLISTRTLDLTKNNSLDISYLDAGLYFLQLQDENSFLSSAKKFIKL